MNNQTNSIFGHLTGNNLKSYVNSNTLQLDYLFKNSKDDMEKCVIAYEPIWAIGPGKTATSEQAEDMCKFIRNVIAKLYNEVVADKVRIQYGGSVKPSNAAEILNMENIDGALVGGASLTNDFVAIVNY